MDDLLNSFNAREKYSRFRILVIGRANAGKTTLLKRVCNTTDEPCIYDEKSNSLLEPTVDRGIHDIDRPFAFANNPQFIFHDSPGFETGDESQLKKVQSFIEKRSRSTEVDDQLHAIWFCFIPNKARFLLDLEKRFFNEQRAGNVPVIAIFTKFDDLISQVYDINLEEDENREIAASILRENLRGPLFDYKFPPKADVCLEDMHEDDGDHQERVKELINKTADSLDDLALKILFVSIQQNNLELCIKYAVKYLPDLRDPINTNILADNCLIWFSHSYHNSYDYGMTEKGGFRQQQGKKQEQFFFQFGGGFFQFLQNKKAVQKFIKLKMSNESSMTMCAALLICLENSFWYQSTSSSFMDAFGKAFALYNETGTQENVEIALKELGDQSGEEIFRVAFSELLLKYRLSHPDNV